MDIVIKVSDKWIESLFITAIEQGAGWFGLSDNCNGQVEKRGNETTSWAENIYASFMAGDVLEIVDELCQYPGSTTPHKLTKERFKEGIYELSNDENFNFYLYSELADQGDGVTIAADIILQYIVFGEVLYV